MRRVRTEVHEYFPDEDSLERLTLDSVDVVLARMELEFTFHFRKYQ